MTQSKMLISSYDVFDTVLTRRVGAPITVFLLLGKCLVNHALISVTPEVFARHRVEAELRASKNVSEYNLTDIYSELQNSIGLDKELCKIIAQMECKLETELTIAVSCLMDEIKKKRNSGQKIVFLSDMYLPEPLIAKLLTDNNIMEKGDLCYVSSEHKKSKRAGSLYKKLLIDEKIDPMDVNHLGNNFEHDVVKPRKQNINSQYFAEGNLNRYEQCLEKHAMLTEGLSSVMAGASRISRLTVKETTLKNKVIREVSAGVVAPTLVSYVLWVLNRANDTGIKNLYFLSRDGQILLLIAKKIAFRLGININLRYLYASRQAWHLPSITKIGPSEYEWIFASTAFLSIKSLLARVCIEPSEIKEILIETGFKANAWDKNLDNGERERAKCLFGHDIVVELALAKAAIKRDLVLKYLKQEGVLDSNSWGIVDIGWHGRLQNSLGAILSTIGHGVPIGYYFGLYGKKNSDYGHREAYLFDHSQNIGYLTLPDLSSVMEMFCSADHGMVKSFTYSNGILAPVKNEFTSDIYFEWGLNCLRDTVDIFIDNLFIDQKLINVHADNRKAVVDVLSMFWGDPSKDEARVWGKFPFEEDQNCTYWNYLAESYTIRHILKLIARNDITPRQMPLWPAGSYVLTEKYLRFIICLNDKIRNKFSHALDKK